MDIGNLIVGIIGACAWIPILIEYLRKQKFGFSLVHCNILKNFTLGNEPNKRFGQFLILGFNIISYNRICEIHELKAFLYTKHGHVFEGIAITENLNFKDGGGLKIPPDKNIQINNIIFANCAKLLYCSFFFENCQEINIDDVEKIIMRIDCFDSRRRIRDINFDKISIERARRIKSYSDVYF